MHWVAFVDNEYLYSTSFKWLGAMIDGIFVDKSGDPVCWLEGGSLKGVYNFDSTGDISGNAFTTINTTS